MDTTTRNAEIRRKRAAGLTLAEIGEEYGISKQRVKQLCPDGVAVDDKAARTALRRAQRAGEGIEAARRAMSDHATRRATAIKEALEAGMSRPRVARELGVATTTVNKRLQNRALRPDGKAPDDAAARMAIHRARVAASSITKASQAMSDLAEERAEAIRDALQAGMSQAAVARELGIQPPAVNVILRSH